MQNYLVNGVYFNMSCVQPFYKKNKYGEVKTIPCGWCINCRIDKRNQWENRCLFEQKKHITSTFLTLTYDNVGIIPNLVKDNDGNLRSTLNYDDLSKFIQRLRKKVKYDNNSKNNIYMQPDFSYIAVGEYGGNGQVFDRCHFHLLIFGLDYSLEKLYQSEWNKGFIYSLPLLKGGIRYVLKYMDKQINGKDAIKIYDDNNLKRPKMITSKSFGSDLFLSDKAYNFAKKNNYCYIGKNNKLIPYPTYYRNKLMGIKKPDDTSLLRKLSDNNIKVDYIDINGRKVINSRNMQYFFSNTDIDKLEESLHSMSSAQFLNEVNQVRRCNSPVYGLESIKL